MNMSPYYYIMVHRDALASITKNSHPTIRLKTKSEVLRRISEVIWRVERSAKKLEIAPGILL